MIMGAEITISLADAAELDRLLGKYPAVKNQVLARAATRTGRWVKTRTLNAICSQINIKRKDINADGGGGHRFGGVSLKRAQENHPVARVTVTGQRIPLYIFGGKPKNPPTPSGVQYAINQGQSKTIKRNAFVVHSKSGHVGIFSRVSQKKVRRMKQNREERRRKGFTIRNHGSSLDQAKHGLPIMELRGPSIPHVAEQNPDFNRMLNIDASARMKLSIEQELNYALNVSPTKPPADEGGDQ